MGATTHDTALTPSAGEYRPLFESNPNPILIVDAQSRRVLKANGAAAREYGYAPEELLDLQLGALWPGAEAVLAGPLPAASPLRTWRQRRRDGRVMDAAIAFQELSFGGRRAIALHVSDVSQRAFSVALIEGYIGVLETIARGAPLGAVLAELVRTMERLSSGMIGSVVLLDADGRHLRHGAAPNLPPAYWRSLDGVEIGSAVGSCGSAMHLGRQVIVSDIAHDPLWKEFRGLALSHGLRACWSAPILCPAGRVLGAFAMYYREVRSPDERDQRLVGAATHLAALAIERDRADQALCADITARKRAEAELARSREQLRALTARLLRVREEERARISREIHDELGQALTALRMNQALVIRGLRAAGGGAAADQLESMQVVVDGVLASVRRIATELRPDVLDALGLAAALEWQATEFASRTGIACQVSVPQPSIELDAERSTALFRIFQEALTNVARHSGARRVTAGLRQEGGMLELSVADNGRGFTEHDERASPSLGLLGMRERAAMLGGETTVTSAPGRGTVVTVRLPAG